MHRNSNFGDLERMWPDLRDLDLRQMNHVPAKATGRIETHDEAQTLEELAKEEIDNDTWNLAKSLVRIGLSD